LPKTAVIGGILMELFMLGSEDKKTNLFYSIRFRCYHKKFSFDDVTVEMAGGL